MNPYLLLPLLSLFLILIPSLIVNYLLNMYRNPLNLSLYLLLRHVFLALNPRFFKCLFTSKGTLFCSLSFYLELS